MLEILVATLKSAVELAIVLALLAACLKATGREGLLQPLRWGAFLALGAGAGLAYGGKSFLEREVAEAAISLLAALLTLGLILWIGSSRPAARAAQAKSGETGRASWVLIFAASLVLVVPMILSIALNAAKALALAGGRLSTGQASEMSAILAALAFAALLGVNLYKVVATIRSRWIALITILSLFILLVREATIVVQTLLVRGMLPLTDWLFRIIAALVNNSSVFYYALFAAACVLVVLAGWDRRGQKNTLVELNPAQKRKLRAAVSRRKFLTLTAGTLLALVIAVERAGAVYANRPLSLSPPVPVTRDGDAVMIATDSVSDGTLHRFSYEATEGTAVRFIVIHKGSAVFGVALDACEFCGPAGYRQDGKNVICNRCGAAINVATIGSPGGCNPIPLSYRQDGASLTVPVEALEAAKGIFGQ